MAHNAIHHSNPAFDALIVSLLCHTPNPQSMDPTDSCRILEPTWPMTEALFYQDPQEIGIAFADPVSAVQPTAEAPRPAHGVDKFRTPESKE